MQIDRGSRVSVSGGISPVIEIVDDAASFAVRHDPARLLMVRAGGYEIRDIATRFDVVSARSRVMVTVAEGAVDITSIGGSATDTTMLHTGQSLDITPSKQIAERRTVDPARASDWVDGRLDYDGTPLALVAADISTASRCCVARRVRCTAPVRWAASSASSRSGPISIASPVARRSRERASPTVRWAVRSRASSTCRSSPARWPARLGLERDDARLDRRHRAQPPRCLRTRRIGSRAALRWSFGDWHATLDGVAQRIDARDSQYDMGNANNYGLELGGRRDLAPVAIDFTTTLQRARLTSASSGMKIDDDDRRLPIVPDISARLAASRTFESAACVPKSMRPLVISVAPG